MHLNDVPLRSNQTQVNRKVIGLAAGGGAKVFVDVQQRPFSELKAGDLLDSTDVCRLFSCSIRSVYRWVGEDLLKPAGKVGREFLFTKRELLRWWNERPQVGRPTSKVRR